MPSLAGLGQLAALCFDSSPAARPPIIDVHLHAFSAVDWKEPARPNPATGAPGPASFLRLEAPRSP